MVCMVNTMPADYSDQCFRIQIGFQGELQELSE